MEATKCAKCGKYKIPADFGMPADWKPAPSRKPICLACQKKHRETWAERAAYNVTNVTPEL